LQVISGFFIATALCRFSNRAAAIQPTGKYFAGMIIAGTRERVARTHFFRDPDRRWFFPGFAISIMNRSRLAMPVIATPK
jgi:hypothetical protein